MRALIAAVAATVAAATGPAAPREVIVFSSSRSPALGRHLDALDARSGTLRVLMRGGQVGTVSPDGRSIAYIAYRAAGGPGVYVSRIDGSDRRLLYDHENVAPFTDVTWSPDGRLIAFPFLGPKIGLVPATGGAPAFVTDARRAIWSRDPLRLAVVTDGEALDLVTLGAGRIRVARGVLDADWSPDGRLAATTYYDALTVRDLRSHSVVLRERGEVVGVRFAPDSRRIAALVARGERRFDLVVSDIHRRTHRTVGRCVTISDSPAQRIEWSPGGDRVAVACGGDVVVARADGGRAQRLGVRFPTRHPVGPPRWVGGRIFVFTAVWNNDRELYLADAATGRATALTHDRTDDDAPALSPDGRSVAFVRGGAVYVLSLADGRERRLRAGADPAWSSDGDALAISVGSEIEIVDARTGGVRRVVGAGAEPAWSPDGSAIAFERDGDIWAAAPDGSAQHQITSGPVLDRMPAYSPDGKRIAYRAVPADGVGIFVADAADGANVTRVTEGGRDPSWSPDGTKLLLELGAELYVVGVDGSGGHVFAPSNGWAGEPSWGRGSLARQ